MTQVSIIEVPSAPKPKRSRVAAGIMRALGIGRREGENFAAAAVRTTGEVNVEYLAAIRGALAEAKRREPEWGARVAAVAVRGGHRYTEAKAEIAAERAAIFGEGDIAVLGDLLDKSADDVLADAKRVERHDALVASLAAGDDAAAAAEVNAAHEALRAATGAVQEAEVARLAAESRSRVACIALDCRNRDRDELRDLLTLHVDLLGNSITPAPTTA